MRTENKAYINIDFDMFSRPDLYPDYQTHQRCMDAIDYDPMLFKHIKNFTEELQLYVLDIDPFLIKWFTNPYSDKVKWECIMKYPPSIKHIHNPSEDMIIYSLETEKLPCSSVEIIENIKNLNDNIVIAAVNNCLHIIPFTCEYYYINENLKLEILKNNWNKECFHYIEKISVDGFSDWFHKQFNKLKLEYGVLE